LDTASQRTLIGDAWSDDIPPVLRAVDAGGTKTEFLVGEDNRELGPAVNEDAKKQHSKSFAH
jgi:hypothetical protein